MNLQTLFLTITPICLLFACAPGAGEAEANRYAWGFYNTTDQTLRMVSLAYTLPAGQTREQVLAVLEPKKAAAFPAVSEMPGRITLSWQTGDGEKHQQEIDLKPVVAHSATFSQSTVWFSYKNGAFTASVMTWTEQHERAQHGLSGPATGP